MKYAEKKSLLIFEVAKNQKGFFVNLEPEAIKLIKDKKKQIKIK